MAWLLTGAGSGAMKAPSAAAAWDLAAMVTGRFGVSSLTRVISHSAASAPPSGTGARVAAGSRSASGVACGAASATSANASARAGPPDTALARVAGAVAAGGASVMSLTRLKGAGRGDFIASTSMPVATTETRMPPSRDSSKVEPKMMLASGSTSSRTRLAASSTSNRVMSGPPVMLIKTPLAPFMEMSSNSGLEIAASAASIERRSPAPSPVPIIALPISPMTERMSAKSRLISPGMTIRSVTPRTPEYKTSSAILKASAKVVFSLATRNRF